MSRNTIHFNLGIHYQQWVVFAMILFVKLLRWFSFIAAAKALDNFPCNRDKARFVHVDLRENDTKGCYGEWM
jgi:hypothetical protein